LSLPKAQCVCEDLLSRYQSCAYHAPLIDQQTVYCSVSADRQIKVGYVPAVGALARTDSRPLNRGVIVFRDVSETRC
jgi:hypothetical protein